MSTQLSTEQIKDNAITKSKILSNASTESVITKVIAGDLISLSSSGGCTAGTGDTTINWSILANSYAPSTSKEGLLWFCNDSRTVSGGKLYVSKDFDGDLLWESIYRMDMIFTYNGTLREDGWLSIDTGLENTSEDVGYSVPANMRLTYLHISNQTAFASGDGFSLHVCVNGSTSNPRYVKDCVGDGSISAWSDSGYPVVGGIDTSLSGHDVKEDDTVGVFIEYTSGSSVLVDPVVRCSFAFVHNA